jgi:hypothetical protein
VVLCSPLKSERKLSSVTSRGISDEPLNELSPLKAADTTYATGNSAATRAISAMKCRHQFSEILGRFLRRLTAAAGTASSA